MKAVLTSILMLMFWINSIVAADEKPGKHLFILSGQSNMEKLNPKISFSPAIREAFGADNVIFIWMQGEADAKRFVLLPRRWVHDSRKNAFRIAGSTLCSKRQIQMRWP